MNAAPAPQSSAPPRPRQFESLSDGLVCVAVGFSPAPDLTAKDARLKPTATKPSLSTVPRFCTGLNALRVSLLALILFLWRGLIVLSAAELAGRPLRVPRKIPRHQR